MAIFTTWGVLKNKANVAPSHKKKLKKIPDNIFDSLNQDSPPREWNPTPKLYIDPSL